MLLLNYLIFMQDAQPGKVMLFATAQMITKLLQMISVSKKQPISELLYTLWSKT